MKKLTIEIQYDENDRDIRDNLLAALEAAEWARVSGDNKFTLIRGELQFPADSIRHYATVNRQAGVKGGCW